MMKNTVPNRTLAPPTTKYPIPRKLFFPPSHEVVLSTIFFWPSNLYVLYLHAEIGLSTSFPLTRHWHYYIRTHALRKYMVLCMY